MYVFDNVLLCLYFRKYIFVTRYQRLSSETYMLIMRIIDHSFSWSCILKSDISVDEIHFYMIIPFIINLENLTKSMKLTPWLQRKRHK